MAEIGILRIVAIVDAWNMNGVHKLRGDKRSTALKRGQCLIAFNRKLTIGRIIDSEGGVHTYYAPPKEIFDIASVSQMVSDGFWVELRVGAKVRQKASDLELVA